MLNVFEHEQQSRRNPYKLLKSRVLEHVTKNTAAEKPQIGA